MTRRRNPHHLLWVLDAEVVASTFPTRRNRQHLRRMRRALAERLTPKFTESETHTL